MDTNTKSGPYTIVVGLDFSDTGALALERAFDLANREPNADLHAVYVASAYGPMLRLELPDDVRTVSIEEASDYLQKYVEGKLDQFQASAPTRFERVVTHVRVGPPADEIAQLAADLDAELVVVGTHGRRGVRRLLLGSVAEGVMRLSHCPVFVVRPKDHFGIELAAAPDIEPPCPRCVAERQRTNGRELWCDEHRQRRGRRHTYHYVDRNSSADENLPLAEKE
ncbi:MAG: universal stress protein [Sorangiineae bacterium]|nr:universal stress protein [Polyangiaceae bacterium]MEB2323964.1 universal stress protein [Sorangiineae bacterium]